MLLFGCYFISFSFHLTISLPFFFLISSSLLSGRQCQATQSDLSANMPVLCDAGPFQGTRSVSAWPTMFSGHGPPGGASGQPAEALRVLSSVPPARICSEQREVPV